MKEPIEFTDRERFLISYYRDPQLSAWSRRVIHDGIYLVLSFGAIGLYVAQQDAAWGMVGYGILFWRVCQGLWQSRLYVEALPSLLRKYDAKVKELAEADPK